MNEHFAKKSKRQIIASETVFIAVKSHRARDKVLSALGDPKRQSYYVSLTSPRSGYQHKGIYRVTMHELAKLDKLGVHRVSHLFTVVRKPYDDLEPCISFPSTFLQQAGVKP